MNLSIISSPTSVHFRYRNRSAARIAHQRFQQRHARYKRTHPKKGELGRWLARRVDLPF